MDYISYRDAMSTVAPIFIDAELQRQFDRDGYARIKILDEAQTRELREFFMATQREHEAVNSLYQSTTHTNDPDLIRRVDDKIRSVMAPELPRFFQNYEPMMCTYITKQPGEGSDTRIHQDPTFVDEQKYVTANIWVALHDINHDNGNMFFIPGTHRYMRSLRVTPVCPSAYDGVFDLLRENITEVPVQAGEAIVINHAVMHGATPNLSGGPRMAAVMAIRSAGSELIFHYLEPGAPTDRIEQYSFDMDTFFHLKRDGRPDESRFLRYISWDFPQITRDDFLAQIGKLRPKEKRKSWFEKIFS
ncbi:MAG: phytanoyl-CoA dioxygenase family protein [Bacteroidetes bacterium]|nr:phytanoyl-CoA dioxygenase family protein [Bacteroidota bacterium]